MQRTRRLFLLLCLLAVAVMVSGPVLAQNVVIYPAKGQSQEQQSRDRYECHTWAVQQTGFDPTNPQVAQAPGPAAPPPAKEAPEGGVARGAARGAAVGAVGGAIAGDAGKGAAAGAAAGAMVGGMKRRDQQAREAQAQRTYEQQQAQAQAQAQGAVAEKQSAYTRALGACMEGRGYTVK